MKKLLLSLLLLFGATTLIAQPGIDEEESCLDAYKKVFKERGADHVPDGMHRNVIVSLDEPGAVSCFYGKARVEGTKVTAVFIKFEDETYQLFEGKDFKVPYGTAIKNGISDPWATKEGNKKISVVFVENIKPKKKQYKQAPKLDPSKL